MLNHRTHNGPIVCRSTWTLVMDRAGRQCQCTGACGSLHSKTGRRCDRDTDREQLLAAPADLTLTPLAAARVPAADLRAWCPACHRKAAARQRARRRDAARVATDTAADTLF